MWKKMSASMLAATSHMVLTWQLFKETNGDCHRNLSMHFLKKQRREGNRRRENSRTQLQDSDSDLRGNLKVLSQYFSMCYLIFSIGIESIHRP